MMINNIISLMGGLNAESGMNCMNKMTGNF